MLSVLLDSSLLLVRYVQTERCASLYASSSLCRLSEVGSLLFLYEKDDVGCHLMNVPVEILV